MRYAGKTSIIYKIKLGEIDTVFPTAGEYITFLLSSVTICVRVCVCVCVCMYVYIYVYVYTNICINKYMYIRICIYMYVYIYMYIIGVGGICLHNKVFLSNACILFKMLSVSIRVIMINITY